MKGDGGLTVTKIDYQAQVLYVKITLNSFFVLMTVGNKKFILGRIYIPPVSSLNYTIFIYFQLNTFVQLQKLRINYYR